MLQPQHLDAFDTPPSFTATRRESELRRDLGIARAELRQERLDPDWTAAAAGFLRDFAKDTALGQPFLIEDAREASFGKITEAPNAKAWGAAVRQAARSGWLVKTGQFGITRCSNQSPRALWRAP